MNILSILTGIAMIGASALALEGVNKVTDGNFYLSSVKYLAEASPLAPDSGSTAPAPAPAPTPPTSGSATQTSPPMPPPAGGSGGGSSTNSGGQPPMMPPPPNSSSGGSGQPMMMPPSSGGGNMQSPMMMPPPNGGFNGSPGSFNKFEPPMMPPPPGNGSMGNFQNNQHFMNGNNQMPGMMQSATESQKSGFFQQFMGIFGGGQKPSDNGGQHQMMGGQQMQTMGGQQKNNFQQNFQQNQRGQSGQFNKGQQSSQSESESGPMMDEGQVQQSLGDINRFRTEIKNTIRQVRKQASSADLDELNQIQAEVDKIYSTAANSSDSSDIQDAIQSFQEGEYHDKVNSIRTRVQIPQELKQFQQSFKRVDKILQTKAVQSLGLNIDKAKQAVDEMKQGADKVQSDYSSGNYDDAQSNLQDLHDNGQPGDIESTISRVRDIKSALKRVKDAEVRTSAEGVLQEVVDKFNNGEYRDARETLDAYSGDLMNMLNQFARARTLNSDASKTQVENLGSLIQKKLQEIDAKQAQSQESQAGSNQ